MVDVQSIAKRLLPDKQTLLVEGVRSLNGVYAFDHGAGWLGHIDWVRVARSVGLHEKRAENVAIQFDKYGLHEGRNSNDGWLLRRGVLVAHAIDATIPTLTPEQEAVWAELHARRKKNGHYNNED